MKKVSLQQIEDYYINFGYNGNKLRKAVEKDKDYQSALKQKKALLAKKFNLTSIEKRKYVMSVDADFEILAKCGQLEKTKLAKQEKELVKLIKSQLENDWRKPLMRKLNQLLNSKLSISKS